MKFLQKIRKKRLKKEYIYIEKPIQIHIMDNHIFEVISTIANNIDFTTAIKTAHWEFDRNERHQNIIRYIGAGRYVASFVVNTDHPNGYEIHNVFDNGVVLIQNIHTRKLVTEIVARPNQIRRYWRGLNQAFPCRYEYIAERAYQHVLKGWNNWK